MQAIQFQSFGPASVLQAVALPDPEPGEKQVLIRVSAAGVSYVDVRQRKGIYNRAETRVGGVELPAVPGMQAVGRVICVGSADDRNLIGRKVVAFVEKGAYAQLLVASSSLCVVAPEDADDATLSVMPMQGLTAYLTLAAATFLRPGESVLVHAAGSGVGNLAVQMAKIRGAGKIIATAASAEKRQHALDSGADVVVDYTQSGWTDKVLDATDGRGVDVLLESIGADIFEQNFRCLATLGRYVIYGSTRGTAEPFEARRLMTRCQSLAGVYAPVFMERPDIVCAGLSFLVDHVTRKNLRVSVALQLPLHEAARAHQLLEDRKVVGAIVLVP